MMNILELLNTEHGVFLTQLNLIESLLNQNTSLDALKAATQILISAVETHRTVEEEILYPLFEERTGMHDSGPTAVMRMGHQQIKDYLEKITAKISKKDITTDEFEKGLIGILTAHNYKEENILYPWIDNSASKEEIESALEKIKKS